MVDSKIKWELEAACSEKAAEMHFLDESDIRVELIDWTPNCYKAICNGALMTWGKVCNKWPLLSPETRFYVVNEVLNNRALPLAKELPTFTFLVSGVSRACADQIFRARMGVSICAKGFKDNDLRHLDMCIPSRIRDAETREKVKKFAEESRKLYREIQGDAPNWAGRCIVPMYAGYHFLISFNYLALQGFCANRMETTEMPDVVAVSWLMRERVKEVFPLLADYLRPACDFAKRDRTLAVNGFAEVFGLPHASDNRWPNELEKYKQLSSESCTDLRKLCAQLEFSYVSPSDWKDYTWVSLEASDKEKFGVV